MIWTYFFLFKNCKYITIFFKITCLIKIEI
ncbi:unnamed protein product [Spirodela intermedia]|uniref:Uncharacterized protein n=1 Tax=Spirodela intermedia TaxID=51605 RepID=A0A7I8IF18_SPIIN|nr:unnamed protein product [Spirodela intermedia]CAA6655452.1 unnamed protein product [Spirodela intermedia]